MLIVLAYSYSREPKHSPSALSVGHLLQEVEASQWSTRGLDSLTSALQFVENFTHTIRNVEV